MYSVKTEQSFDAAHFLQNYDGKCKNIHGHRWCVQVEICSETLGEDGMVADFSKIKKCLKECVNELDHAFIYEKNSLREQTKNALLADDFKLIEVSFRPTAENFAKYFFDCICEKGYKVSNVCVYETPNNMAKYEK